VPLNKEADRTLSHSPLDKYLTICETSTQLYFHLCKRFGLC